MTIKNVVFDIGNVLVTWNPLAILQETFSELKNSTDASHLLQKIFKADFWYDLNAGKITEVEAVEKYHIYLGKSKAELNLLLEKVKRSLTPLEDTLKIVERLHQANFPLYIISDNTIEIMAHLKKTYDFWNYFSGIVISAEIGHLKPSPIIYQHLLTTYQLKPEETIFFDDVDPNVKGAKDLNMHAFQFTTAEKCISDLKRFGINFD